MEQGDQNTKDQSHGSIVMKEIRDWGYSIVTAMIVALFINVFVLELYTVQQSSMWPTFQEGDQILAWKLSRLVNSVPDYGDIVIVDSNVAHLRTLGDEIIDSALISKIIGRENRNIWIKRVIGRPGDYLEYNDHKVYRNGIELEESYINEEMIASFESILVPDDHIYVMGDNRNNSGDSRNVGPIPFENIRGRVIFRFSPFNKRATF